MLYSKCFSYGFVISSLLKKKIRKKYQEKRMEKFVLFQGHFMLVFICLSVLTQQETYHIYVFFIFDKSIRKEITAFNVGNNEINIHVFWKGGGR